MQQRVKIGMVCSKANGHSSLMGEFDYGSCGSHEVATIVIEGDTDIDLTQVAEELADLVRRWGAALEDAERETAERSRALAKLAAAQVERDALAAVRDYTPTTGWMRIIVGYAMAQETLPVEDARQQGYDWFDRWLTKHDAEVAAKALEEARDKMMPPLNWNLDPYTGNERPGTSSIDEAYRDVHREMTDFAAEYRNTTESEGAR